MCPKCQKIKLDRCMSVFSTSRNRGEEEDMPIPDLDESKMEKAMNLLSKEAEHVNEDDPRQAADLMRKLTDMTGLNLGPRKWVISLREKNPLTSRKNQLKPRNIDPPKWMRSSMIYDFIYL